MPNTLFVLRRSSETETNFVKQNNYRYLPSDMNFHQVIAQSIKLCNKF